jgi:hypothetical protein
MTWHRETPRGWITLLTNMTHNAAVVWDEVITCRIRAFDLRLAVALTMAAACAAPDQPLPADAATDSAGIAIVHNTLDSVPLWTVDSLPIARIAEQGANTVFSEIMGAVLLADGGIAIADRYEENVRVFDSTGRYQRTAVRRGGGPAELLTFSGLHATGADSLYVMSMSLNDRSMVILDAAARAVRKIPSIDFTSDVQRPHSSGLQRIVGVLDDGTLVAQEERSWAVPRGADPHAMPDSVKRFLRQRIFLRGAPGETLLTEYALSARIRDGQMEPTTAVIGNQFLVSDPDTFAFEIFAPSGRVERIVRVDRVRIPAPPPAPFDEDGTPNQAPTRQMFYPDVYSFIRGANESIWIATFEKTAGDSVRVMYFVVDHEGHLIAQLRLPVPGMISAVRGDRLLVEAHDRTTDTPTFAIYRYQRVERRSPR